ncbi:NLR family CARD domain containing 3 [Balamuthia mandrillaris]
MAARVEGLIPSGATQANLQRIWLGAEGGRAVAKALYGNKNLTSLNLWFCCLGTEGAKAIAEALRHNTTLTSLDISWNEIGSEGARAIAEALCYNSTLSTLDLRTNDLGAEGGEALLEALDNNTTLSTLRIAGNNIPEHLVRELQEKAAQGKKRKRQAWNSYLVGQVLSDLQALRQSRNNANPPFHHSTTVLEEVLNKAPVVGIMTGHGAIPQALAAKAQLEAVQREIAEGKTFPNNKLLAKRDQARRKFVDVAEAAEECWRQQDVVALQQQCMGLVQLLRNALPQKEEMAAIREQDMSFKRRRKETKGEQKVSPLQHGRDALCTFKAWQRSYVNQNLRVGKETEEQAKRVSQSLQQVACAFSDPDMPITKELLKESHIGSLISAIQEEQLFLADRPPPPLDALHQGMKRVMDHLQELCDESQEAGVVMARLRQEVAQVRDVLTSPPGEARVMELSKVSKKMLRQMRIAQVELDTAEDNEEREDAQRKLDKAKKQWKQQVALLEREALWLVTMSNSHCPELRFKLQELGLEAVDMMTVDSPYRCLDHYDNLQLLASGGRHCVMHGQFQGKPCVLKEFDLSFSTDRQHFLRELKRLRGLQHEHIVQVEAAFVQEEKGRSKGWIHMPFYSGGNLCEWLRDGTRRM